MHTCISSHGLKRSWRSCPRRVNASNKNTPSTHHPRRRNVTTLMVGLKKRSHTQKSHPKVVNPRDTAGERKKKKNLDKYRCPPHTSPAPGGHRHTLLPGQVSLSPSHISCTWWTQTHTFTWTSIVVPLTHLLHLVDTDTHFYLDKYRCPPHTSPAPGGHRHTLLPGQVSLSPSHISCTWWTQTHTFTWTSIVVPLTHLQHLVDTDTHFYLDKYRCPPHTSPAPGGHRHTLLPGQVSLSPSHISSTWWTQTHTFTWTSIVVPLTHLLHLVDTDTHFYLDKWGPE